MRKYKSIHVGLGNFSLQRLQLNLNNNMFDVEAFVDLDLSTKPGFCPTTNILAKEILQVCNFLMIPTNGLQHRFDWVKECLLKLCIVIYVLMQFKFFW